MRRAGIEGEVLVEFIVDTNGNVRNPFVVRSTQREFEAAAIQAISKWKFRPGRRGGRDVNTGRVQQPFSFKINE
jgi:protein TonB